MKKRSLVLITILTLVFGLGGWWYLKSHQKRPYNSLPGTYECEGFGIPDDTFNRLRIDNEFKFFGVSKGVDYPVGKLSPKNFSAANLELTMGVIHAPTFKLDPFTQIVVEAVGSNLEVSARGQDGYFTKKCRQIY